MCASTALHQSAWMPWKRRQLYASRVRSGERSVDAGWIGHRIVDMRYLLYRVACIWRWRLPHQRRPKTARVTRLTLRLKHTVAHDYTHHPDILPCLLRGPTPSPTLPLSVYSYLLYGNLLSHHGARYRNHREVSSSVTSLHPPFMQQSTHFESNRAGVDGRSHPPPAAALRTASSTCC